MVDVDQLTNEEVRDQLMLYGYDPGPVIGSTRNVYVNKLRRLMEGGSESDAVAPPQPTASVGAGAEILKSSPKRGDFFHSPQKSRSPRRTTRSSTQDSTALSKVQNTSFTSKISRASSKAGNVSPAKSRLVSDDAEHPSYTVSSVPVSPKVRMDFESDSHAEVQESPESHGSASKPSVTSESASLDAAPNSAKPKTYTYETVSKVYRTTPATRFTSIRDSSRNGKISDSSDDDLRGEESSRYILPSWKEDHTYSARYNSEQSPVARHCLSESAAVRCSRGPRNSSEVTFENSYSGYGNRQSGLVNRRKASLNYGRIGLSLFGIIILAIFIFFIVQNYAELELGDGNKEEF
uniref:LEM domain-containing protein n=1 Tax=Setaria digitata TaxID=48799 RepID=A0A915PHI8_9BILA